MILTTERLCFSYKKDGPPVVDDFSMAVESHERVGLLAPSGFGKTTLCQLIAGYLTPDSGRVLLDGAALPKSGYCPVQMIWQHPEKAVNPRLRMRDVLAEGDRVEPRVIEALGIEKGWLDRFPAELSGGEMQRFCIARALGQGTKFLLCDEISTMLDLITQSQIWNFLLEEVEARRIGLIAISHSDALIRRVCTRVIDLTAPPQG